MSRSVLVVSEGLSGPTFFRDGNTCNISMSANLISIDCTDITIEAAKKLVELHDKHFKREGKVYIQNSTSYLNTKI